MIKIVFRHRIRSLQLSFRIFYDLRWEYQGFTVFSTPSMFHFLNSFSTPSMFWNWISVRPTYKSKYGSQAREYAEYVRKWGGMEDDDKVPTTKDSKDVPRKDSYRVQLSRHVVVAKIARSTFPWKHYKPLALDSEIWARSSDKHV